MSVLADLTARLGLLNDLQPATTTTTTTTTLTKPNESAANESIAPDTLKQGVEPLGYTLTAATASPEWRQARDLYLQHLMTCRACHAPTTRYCDIGACLHHQYESTPMLSVLVQTSMEESPADKS